MYSYKENFYLKILGFYQAGCTLVPHIYTHIAASHARNLGKNTLSYRYSVFFQSSYNLSKQNHFPQEHSAVPVFWQSRSETSDYQAAPVTHRHDWGSVSQQAPAYYFQAVQCWSCLQKPFFFFSFKWQKGISLSPFLKVNDTHLPNHLVKTWIL